MFQYSLNLPIMIFSYYSAAMLDLFVCLLNHQLVEDTYSATVAQLSYNIYPSDKGLIMKISGFNDKLIVSCLSY